MKTLYEQQHRILTALDHGSWKHSWHLPKDRNGYIDWGSLETRNKVAEILQEKREEAQKYINLIESIELPPESYYD